MDASIVMKLATYDVKSIARDLQKAVSDSVVSGEDYDFLFTAYLLIKFKDTEITEDSIASLSVPDYTKSDLCKVIPLIDSIKNVVSDEELLAFFLYAEAPNSEKLLYPNSSVVSLSTELLKVGSKTSCCELGNTHGEFIREAYIRGVNEVAVTDNADALTYLRADVLGCTLTEFDESKKYDANLYITGQISANISESEHRIIRMLAESEANAVVFVPSAVTFTNAPDVVRTRNFISKSAASVIQMTAGICNYTHASTCLIVLGANSDSIRFVNAQDIYSGKHRDVYLADSDIKDIISAVNSDTDISVIVSCDDLTNTNYELLPSKYTNIPEVKNAMKLIDATVHMYYSAKLENAKSAKNAIYFVGKRVRLFDPDVELPRSAVVVDLNPEKILAKYAYYFFNSPIGNDVINHGGSGVTNILHHRDVENLDIPTMSIKEQQELITKADSLVNTIEEAQADLDSLF